MHFKNNEQIDFGGPAPFLATVGMVLYGRLTQNLAAAEEDTLYIEARNDIETEMVLIKWVQLT